MTMTTFRCTGPRGCGIERKTLAAIERHIDTDHLHGGRYEIVLPEGGENGALGSHPNAAGTSPYVRGSGDDTPATHDAAEGVVSAPVVGGDGGGTPVREGEGASNPAVPTGESIAAALSMERKPAKRKRAKHRAGARQPRPEAERVTTGPATPVEKKKLDRIIGEARRELADGVQRGETERTMQRRFG